MPAPSKPSPSRAPAKPRSRPSSAHRNAPAPRRYGSETPRIYTKPLRRLTRNSSLGYDVIDFAAWLRARLLQIADLTDDPNLAAAYRNLIPALLPWQRWFLIHALELLPGPEKIFRFRIILLLVARQNGKTTLMIVLVLWRLFQDGAPKIIGASTKVEQAEETWDQVLLIAELIPELADEIGHVSKVNGQKSIQLDSLEEYFPQATNSNAGRGWSAEMVLVDELRSHKTWDTWSAISKTTTAKERGQVFGASNAGDAQAIVLRQLRDSAIAAIAGKVLDGVDEDEIDAELRELLEQSAIGLFEWSAREDRGIRDRDGWYEANPSLGHTITEQAIAVSLSDPEWVFRTEVLCQFVDTSEGGPFAEGSWEDSRVPTVVRDRDRPVGYCVDVSYDRKMSYIAIGYFDVDGRLRGEIAARRAGTEWIIPWLQSPDRLVKPELVTLQSVGAPVSTLTPEFEAAGIDLVPWQGADVPRASGILYDEIERGTTTHGNQPVLDVAAGTAVPKAAGDGWLIDRKNSPQDAAPLVAFAGVLWLMRVHASKKRASVYETRGLLTI